MIEVITDYVKTNVTKSKTEMKKEAGSIYDAKVWSGPAELSETKLKSESSEEKEKFKAKLKMEELEEKKREREEKKAERAKEKAETT